MTPTGVRKSLLEEPDRRKEISTGDGRRFRVVGIETWAIGPDYLIVFDRGEEVHIDHRNIASIRIARRNGA